MLKAQVDLTQVECLYVTAYDCLAVCGSPVLTLEVMRDMSKRREGRTGVVLSRGRILGRSEGLLILERGAKMPEDDIAG